MDWIKRITTFLTGIIVVLLLFSAVHSREVRDLFPDHPGALIYFSETLSEPRPVRLHFLSVDLRSKILEVVALTGEDPDGEGPAESQLTLPDILIKRFNAIAAVNANAFAALSDESGIRRFWYDGQPVDIHGMVVSRGITLSPIETGRVPFRVDSAGRPAIGDPNKNDFVMEAVSDWFSPLIVESRIIPDSADNELHPRTALGFDESGEWLMLVVADGRQPGYSEGVTLHELARILKSKGCTQSINLDGGGSSIMLLREEENKIVTLNRPSGGAARPVPVMLGIRIRSDKQD